MISHGQIINQSTNKVNNNWKIISDPDYSIIYPPNWELNQSKQMGTSFILFSPLDSVNDVFKENVNLVIQNVSTNHIDLDKFVELSENQIETMATNSKIEENRRIKHGEKEFHKMVYIADQGILHLKFEQYYWVVDEKAYILTLTTEQSKYKDYKEVGENIINSFVIKK